VISNNKNGEQMSDVQIDVNKIIESLTNQIAAQAQRIAVLEATIGTMREMSEKTTTPDIK
jgi:EAL domain-containing protein (putative c-di-GMP-specific phosphodiesterase class I)